MLRRFKADLHIHTCLSPCGDLQMSPQKITAQVLRQNIDVIAICDHNSAENVPAVIKAAEGTNVVVLPGMEVCSNEEIHVLAIFENVDTVFEMQSLVYSHLPGKNNPDVFGLQVVANDSDEVVAFQDRLLIGALDMSVDKIVKEIHRLGGAAIASHIDRESYSVISQLGFIPDTLKFDAVELSSHIQSAEAQVRFASYADCTFVRNSDAHFLRDVGKNTSGYMLENPSFSEIIKALRKENGRMVCES
ncbi:MAG: PHP domain-containing protein [Ignavibacteria bacterium]|nr:PHP domain-containing protein [Ignavibacteria bacterium]